MSLAFFPQFIRGLTWPIMKSPVFKTTEVRGSNQYSTTLQNTRNPEWHWTLIYNYLLDDHGRTLPIYSPWTDYEILQGFFLQQGGMAQPFLLNDPGSLLGSPDNFVGPGLLNVPWQANRLYILDSIIVVAGNAWQATAVTGPTGWTLPSGFSGAGPVADGGTTWTKLGVASSLYPNGCPNPNAQLQIVTDGTNYYAPVQRNFGGQFLEDITDFNNIPTLGGYSPGFLPLSVWGNGLPLSSTSNCTIGGDFVLGGPGLSLSDDVSFKGYYLKLCGSPPPTPITAQFNFFFRVRFEMDELDFEQFLAQVFTIGGPDAKNGAGYLKLMTATPNEL